MKLFRVYHPKTKKYLITGFQRRYDYLRGLPRDNYDKPEGWFMGTTGKIFNTKTIHKHTKEALELVMKDFPEARIEYIK